jgi:eukaryotic-like serine/threonine-protein kinase
MTEIIGRDLGRYHILAQLGEGGMASVYEAVDTVLKRQVAIKVILPQRRFSKLFIRRFEREAMALAQLSHPNIVKVLDYGEQAGLPFLVMEYLPGGTLKQKLGRQLEWRAAVNLVIPIARALAYAHERQIVHRDVKPANILLTQTGEPMLSDFGVAKILETEETTDLTGTGVGIGTPDYMAPEQGRNESVDRRADIYALGVMLYEMLTGRKPFQADTPMAVLLKKSTDPLPRPRTYALDLPGSVETILIRCLQPAPENRYPTANDLIADLEKALAGIPPRKVSLLIPAVLIGAAALLVLAAGFLAMNFVKLGAVPTPTAILPVRSPSPAAMIVLPTSTVLVPSPVPATATDAVRISGRDGMEMLYVPAGEFIHGVSAQDLSALRGMCPNCPVDQLEDAQPQSRIYLDAFWIDKTEVTNAQFARFVADSGYRTIAETTDDSSYVQDITLKDFVHVPDADWRHPRGKRSDILSKDDYPVTQVSWQDAFAYCQWAERRLPTEAEWEKAARGEDGRLFPWGNRPPGQEDLNYNFTPGTLVRVGSYPGGASPYGALDMSGNVWEFVADYYSADYYANIPDVNPSGPVKGKDRIFRGGSWASEFDPYLLFVTTFYRLTNHDTISSDVLGFRCASSQ